MKKKVLQRLEALPRKVALPLRHLVDVGQMKPRLLETVLDAGELAGNTQHLLGFAAGIASLEMQRVPATDTIQMAKEIGATIRLDWSPRRWREEHDRLSRILTYRSLRADNVEYDVSSFVELLPEKFPGYVVSSRRRLATIGHTQRHCVASYDSRIAAGDLAIVCVILDKTRWTVEVRKTHMKAEPLSIQQIRTTDNRCPTPCEKARIHELLGVQPELYVRQRDFHRALAQLEAMNTAKVCEDLLHAGVDQVLYQYDTSPGILLWHLLLTDARDRITGAHEQTVLLRWSSQDRYDLYEDTCAQNNARGTVHTQIPPLTYDPDYEQLRGYHHSFLLQCPFPQKTLPANTELWRSQHGRRLMVVRAGYSVVNGDVVGRDIPSGAIPRIVLPYIFSQAVRYGRYVCMGRTLHQFMKETGFSTGSRNYQAITEQTLNLACSTITLHEIVHGSRGADIYDTAAVPIASKLRLDPEELTISPEHEVTALTNPQQWESNIIISQPLFDLITENPVPLNIEHLTRLTRSPRRMDLYCWLSYRTYYVRKTVRIPLTLLQPIFGSDIRCERLFKHRIKKDLAEICTIHPFRVELDGQSLKLQKPRSHPTRYWHRSVNN